MAPQQEFPVRSHHLSHLDETAVKGELLHHNTQLLHIQMRWTVKGFDGFIYKRNEKDRFYAMITIGMVVGKTNEFKASYTYYEQ